MGLISRVSSRTYREFSPVNMTKKPGYRPGNKRRAPATKPGVKQASKKAKRLKFQKRKIGDVVPTAKPEVNFKYLSKPVLDEKFPGVVIPSCYHGPYLPFLATDKSKPNAQPTLVFCCSYNRSVKYPNCPETKEPRVPKCKQRCSESDETADKFKFCFQCNKLYRSKHGKFTQEQTRQPMKNLILYAKTSDKTEAQYLLADRSTNFIRKELVSKFDTVLCIGMPRLHEAIKASGGSTKSYLLDMDERFSEFFPDSFHRYNMFNCTFFGENNAVMESPLKPSGNVLVAVDPPYGGLANSFIDAYLKLQSFHPDATFKIAWIFPYFHVKEMQARLPAIKILNYVVDYDNHERFQAKLTGRNASVSRICTDIDRTTIQINDPLNKFCKLCSISVLINMRHCPLCDECVGDKFRHCSKCKTCVKESWEHCVKCDRCRPTYHMFCYKQAG